MSIDLKNKFKTFICLALLIGLGLGLFSARLLMARYPKLLCGARCQNSVTENRDFFSDVLVLSSPVGSKEPFSIYLSLNRKKIGNQFIHYYFGNYLYQGQRKKLYTSFNSNSPQIQPSGFIKSYVNLAASDLSTRESVNLEFVDGDLKLSAGIENLEGDFIVKNSLEYTKYVSVGRATVNVGSLANVYLEKTYSPDYSKYIFFDGYNELQSMSQVFIFWDDQNNFYLLDKSEVNSELKNYKSHAWALYKNQTNKFFKKAFAANIETDEIGGHPKKWTVEIPDFDFNWSLVPQLFYASDFEDGLLQGTIKTPYGDSKIQGYFSYNKYNE